LTHSGDSRKCSRKSAGYRPAMMKLSSDKQLEAAASPGCDGPVCGRMVLGWRCRDEMRSEVVGSGLLCLLRKESLGPKTTSGLEEIRVSE
jgi:hypothetical protein